MTVLPGSNISLTLIFKLLFQCNLKFEKKQLEWDSLTPLPSMESGNPLVDPEKFWKTIMELPSNRKGSQILCRVWIRPSLQEEVVGLEKKSCDEDLDLVLVVQDKEERVGLEVAGEPMPMM